MSLRPDSSEDGPVTVYTTEGDKLQFDRLVHSQSGMVTLFDVNSAGVDNRVVKGQRAKVIPVRKIEEIEYENFGPSQ